MLCPAPWCRPRQGSLPNSMRLVNVKRRSGHLFMMRNKSQIVSAKKPCCWGNEKRPSNISIGPVHIHTVVAFPPANSGISYTETYVLCGTRRLKVQYIIYLGPKSAPVLIAKCYLINDFVLRDVSRRRTGHICIILSATSGGASQRKLRMPLSLLQ